jgi:hypothetical protein
MEAPDVLAAVEVVGLVSVGAGWPSPAAWVVAGAAIVVLALIARWAGSRPRRKDDVDAPAGEALPAPRGTGSPQRVLGRRKQTRKETR